MMNLDYPRDLIMIGAIFGIAAFVWAGWAQERPPGTAWRVYLGLLSLAGLALSSVSILFAISNWAQGTAIDPQAPAFAVYVVIAAIEFLAGAVIAVILVRRKRIELVAPAILALVGFHFFALAVVFEQPVLHLAAALLMIVALVALYRSRERAAPSFWCGALGAPIFLAVGAWCAAAGIGAL